MNNLNSKNTIKSPLVTVLLLMDDKKHIPSTWDNTVEESLNYIEIIKINLFSKVKGKKENKNIIFKSISYLIEKANGKYIYFINSGDCLKKNSLKHLYETALLYESEIVLFNSKLFSSNKVKKDFDYNIKIKNDKQLITDYSNFKKYVFTNYDLIGNKFFSKKFLLENKNELFNKNFTFYGLNIKSLLLSDNISFDSNALLYHRVSNLHNDSLKINEILKISSEEPETYIDLIIDLENFLIKKSLINKFNNEFSYFKTKILIDNLDYCKLKNYKVFIPKEERKILQTKDNHTFDYSKYYNSNSKYVGFSYEIPNKIFQKTKEIFIKSHISFNNLERGTDEKFEIYLEKYERIMESSNYKDYKENLHLKLLNDVSDENKTLHKKNIILTKILNRNQLDNQYYNFEKDNTQI